MFHWIIGSGLNTSMREAHLLSKTPLVNLQYIRHRWTWAISHLDTKARSALAVKLDDYHDNGSFTISLKRTHVFLLSGLMYLLYWSGYDSLPACLVYIDQRRLLGSATSSIKMVVTLLVNPKVYTQ